MMDPDHAPAVRAGDVSPLTAAMREARIETAEQTGVVVDLHDAELARLEILNDALSPIFADIPPEIQIFDRGITQGRQPRLWLDSVAHVEMGRDKRVYRFLLDSHLGRRIGAESTAVEPIVQAVTRYVARRLVERERALAAGPAPNVAEQRFFAETHRRRKWRGVGLFALGVLAGAIGLLAIAWFLPPHY
ncbi:hypothetical protein [Variibacter gotjawalensis]|nr:hypothetical protein [Variibacter gotjawalensis]NIK49240.1 hypothetical protein [Variibacter gotjawalensis]